MGLVFVRTCQSAATETVAVVNLQKVYLSLIAKVINWFEKINNN